MLIGQLWQGSHYPRILLATRLIDEDLFRGLDLERHLYVSMYPDIIKEYGVMVSDILVEAFYD